VPHYQTTDSVIPTKTHTPPPIPHQGVTSQAGPPGTTNKETEEAGGPKGEAPGTKAVVGGLARIVVGGLRSAGGTLIGSPQHAAKGPGCWPAAAASWRPAPAAASTASTDTEQGVCDRVCRADLVCGDSGHQLCPLILGGVAQCAGPGRL